MKRSAIAASRIPHSIRVCHGFEIATGNCGLAGQFRQTKVEYLGVAAPGYEYVSRFDVAMHDAFAMSRVERVRDVTGDGEKSLRFNRTTRDQVAQGYAVEELHDHKSAAILFADVDDPVVRDSLADHGVVQW
jgi:hypothetical protein